MKQISILLFIFYCHSLMGQDAVIKGRVYDAINNEPIAFASVRVDSTSIGATTDIDGNYRIEGLNPGTYNVECFFIGFRRNIIYEVMLSTSKASIVDFPLVKESKLLQEVEIKSQPFIRKEESPLSMRTINATEIYRSPGANRDISKVIQILPGVASSVSFRNDIIVRGGAPNENRFFLDGIEVPNINHFATQGSSGGPVGMINVNFIREVDFYAGAFPANRGNALSSVMEFKQIEGNDEKLNGSFALGSSDVGLTLDGPLGKKSSFILSARRSYLQLLFKALALPFLPTYNDFQFKQTINANTKNKINIIGLAAIDDFRLNKKVNDNLTDVETIRRNNYILGNLPVNEQWNYAIGANWTHFSSNSYQNIIVSRNQLNNKSIKYKDNIELPEFLLLDYQSQEIENKFRIEQTYRKNDWKLNFGAGFENVLYTNSTFNQKESGGNLVIVDFNSRLNLNKVALFTQLSKSILENRLTLSGGIRFDFNDYDSAMKSMLNQFSPRLSASYALNEKWSLNFNSGRYYQLPAYTVMGYRDSTETLINKENNLTYIRADHLVAGIEFNPTIYSKITFEAFQKWYSNYPFLTGDSISLANLGADFGVIGNEPVVSSSKGKSYGFEVLVQQKLSSSVYGIISYTFVRSEFKDKRENYVASAWDNGHILNITAGKKFKRNWEFGLKFRLLGGAPYTPYDIQLSALKNVWDVTAQGIHDFDRLNEERYLVSHGLDIRLDKRWFFKKWAIDLYLDIQNVYNFQTKQQAYLDVVRDANGMPVTDPANPVSYKLSEIENTSGTVLPSIGLMVEF